MVGAFLLWVSPKVPFIHRNMCGGVMRGGRWSLCTDFHRTLHGTFSKAEQTSSLLFLGGLPRTIYGVFKELAACKLNNNPANNLGVTFWSKTGRRRTDAGSISTRLFCLLTENSFRKWKVKKKMQTYSIGSGAWCKLSLSV